MKGGKTPMKVTKCSTSLSSFKSGFQHSRAHQYVWRWSFNIHT